MPAKSDDTYSFIFNEASNRAALATAEYLKSNPDAWYPCGFSWVKIKPARGPFVNFLKKNNLGRVDTGYGGYVIYNPSRNPTQSMEAKKLGSMAFVEYVLRHLPNLDIKVESRID